MACSRRRRYGPRRPRRLRRPRHRRLRRHPPADVGRAKLPLVLVAGALMLVGCAEGEDDRLVLDGRPRLPDAEGVVEKISFEQITLDGGRSYEVRKDLQSFSTYTLEAVPMLHRLGQY